MKINKILLVGFLVGVMSFFLTHTIFGDESKVEYQTPVKLTPGLEMSWGYEGDHYLGVKPNLDLSLSTKSGTDRKIGFSTYGEVLFKEYLYEEGVESSSDIRNIDYYMNASISSDFTSKISGSFGAQAAIGIGNTYENASGDYKWMDVGPKITFKPLPKTKIKVGYTFDISSSNNPYTYKTSGNEGTSDDTLSTLRDVGAFPSSVFNPDYPTDGQSAYYQTVFGPPSYATGDTTDTVDYKNYTGVSLSQGFANEKAPTVSSGYDFVINRDSNNDARDLWFSHVVKAGMKQPMWKDATFEVAWKFDIKNWDTTMSTDQSEYKQDILNRTDLSISQGLNDFLSLNLSYRNDYYFGNTREKATVEHSGGAALSISF